MKRTTARVLAKKLNIHPARSLESQLKAKLISVISKTVNERGMTHLALSKLSGIPRSAVTGILSGSLQKVTLDRVLRLVDALELTAEIRIRDAA